MAGRPRRQAKPAAGYKATGARIQVVTDDGRSSQYVFGDILPSNITEESLENLKSLGFVEPIDDAPSVKPEANAEAPGDSVADSEE